MKSCVLHAAKDLRVEDRPVPPIGADEVRVRFGAGGICGSDLHYYFEGRVGDFAVTEPMVLGHEVAGEVVETGPDVARIRVGDRVTINPGIACRSCGYCRAGNEHLCSDMRYLGSASRTPHVQGAFQELFVARESQCAVVPEDMDFATAVFAEPLGVALHAVNRAMPVAGKHLLVTGCGPIGALILLAARNAGASSVSVTDISDERLEVARALGAEHTVNVAREPQALEPFKAGKGWFDAAIEASGAPAAIGACFECVRAGGRIVQVGFLPPGEVGVAVNRLMAKEIDYVGSFRFNNEFTWAVDALVKGHIDVGPLLSGQFPVSRVDEAFAAAAARDGTMKIQLVF
jgi:L-idonate 5-dehydrogenase